MRVLLLLVIAMALSAEVTDPGYVPLGDTTVASSTKALRSMHLNNKSAGTVNCVVKDRSTNCGGGVCTIWGPAPLGAAGATSSIVSWNFNGTPAPGGFTWSCDTASAVVGSIQYQ